MVGKEYALRVSGGKYTLVDEEDYYRFGKFVWSLNQYGYVVRNTAQKGIRNPKNINQSPWKHDRTITLSREILSAPDDLQVDHINGDKLDNRRANLRLATRAENCQNCGPRSTNTSGFKGVKKAGDKWTVYIQAHRKQYYLGTYKHKVLAALAYDKAARKYHGEFARLNFPEVLT